MKKRERLAQCLPGFEVRKICCFHSLGFLNFYLLSYLAEVLMFKKPFKTWSAFSCVGLDFMSGRGCT